jgi:hypothetical protein
MQSRRHVTATQRPSREAFIAYWKDYDTFGWDGVLLYLVYPGVLALYGLLIRWIDSEGRFWLPSLIVAVWYVLLYPYLLIRRVHTRFARFIHNRAADIRIAAFDAARWFSSSTVDALRVLSNPSSAHDPAPGTSP